jgi:hypothetical protein
MQSGELFVAVDDPALPAFRIDVHNDVAIDVFQGYAVWGSAYDSDADRILFSSGSSLYEWPIGGSVSLLGVMENSSEVEQLFNGLAYYNGTLFGCGGTESLLGIHTIDVATLETTLTVETAERLGCGGLAADPDTGDLYFTSDDPTIYPPGLYLLNQDGTGQLITGYPPGEVDVDGLAIGDGKAYLVTDDPSPSLIYVWDLSSAAYQTPLTSPWVSTSVRSAAAWIEDTLFRNGFEVE